MKLRRFGGRAVVRLIVSVEKSTVERLDRLICYTRHPTCGNRSEFVRQAIEEKLAQETPDDYSSP